MKLSRPQSTRASPGQSLILVLLLSGLMGCASTVGQGSANLATADRAATAAPAEASGASSVQPGAAMQPEVAQASAATSGATGEAATPESRVALDPLRPEQAVDLTDQHAQEDLWARLRLGFAMPDLTGPLVQQKEKYYASKPDYLRRMAERSGRYLFHVLEEIQKRGMPTELALLPFVESGFNPQAMSSAKASGMWQFIPSTGKSFDLKQNVFRDDRRDVLASTRAALDYLTRLHAEFQDWHLALAAYNWGEGSVRRAIARNLKAGKPTDYASLKMPQETQQYVPKLQAIKNIVAAPELFVQTLPPLKNHPYFLGVPVLRDIDVALAAKLADVSEEEFRSLNPQMNKPVILAAGTEQILLPYDNAEHYLESLENHKGPLSSWTAWIAPTNLKPAEAAKKVGMSEAALREVNRIPARMLIRAGSTLLVPRQGHIDTDVSETLASNATMALAPEFQATKRMTVRVGKGGESLAALASRYRVSPAQLAQWNRVAISAHFKPGTRVVVQQGGPAASATQVAASSHRRTPGPARSPTSQRGTASAPRSAKSVKLAQR